MRLIELSPNKHQVQGALPEMGDGFFFLSSSMEEQIGLVIGGWIAPSV